MATLKQKREELEHKQKQLATIFEKAKKKGEGQYDFAGLDDEESKSFFGDAESSPQRVEKINHKNQELNDLVDEVAELTKAEKSWESINERIEKSANKFLHPTGDEPKNDGDRNRFKSLGSLVAQSKQYAEWSKQGGLDFKFKEMMPSDALAQAYIFKTLGSKAVEMKTTMSRSAGYDPEALRLPGFVEDAVRPVQLLDIIPMNSTSYDTIKYMEETTRTHNAAETSEEGNYPEDAFAFTEQTSPVEKFATSLPVTDEQLEDVAMIESYINTRLMFSLRQRLDSQVLLGDGNTPNIEGISQNGSIQTQAKGSDPVPDAFYKAMTKIRVTGRAMPTHHIMHPNDWQQIRLLSTADGIYLWGPPSEAGPERMWGLPVIQCDAGSEGTGYVGSFNPAWISLFEKRGIDVQVGYVGSQFKQGLRTVRADMRLAFVIFRPEAFCSVTGI